MELKERIKKMNIVKTYIKINLYALPFDSRDKALSLIQDIDNELNWFKLQRMKKVEKDKQLNLF